MVAKYITIGPKSNSELDRTLDASSIRSVEAPENYGFRLAQSRRSVNSVHSLRNETAIARTV